VIFYVYIQLRTYNKQHNLAIFIINVDCHKVDVHKRTFKESRAVARNRAMSRGIYPYFTWNFGMIPLEQITDSLPLGS